MKRDELYDIGLFFDKIKFNFYTCKNCGRDVIIYRKTVGKPPIYCKKCSDLLRNDKKEKYFCEDCGKEIDVTTTTSGRKPKLCSHCLDKHRAIRNRKYYLKNKN